MLPALTDIPAIWRNHKVPSPRNRAALIALHSGLSIATAPGRWRNQRPRVPCPDERPRILMVRADGLGDIVMTTAAFQALRAHYRHSHITLLTTPLAREMVEPLPWFDEVMAADLRHLSLRATARLGRSLQDRQFDVGIDFRGDVRSVWLLAHTTAAVRVGHRYGGLSPLLTHVMDFGLMHQADEALALAKALGAPSAGFSPSLVVPPAGRDEACAWLKSVGLQGRRFAALHVAPARPARQWPAPRFAAVADRIAHDLRLTPVLVGTRSDERLIAEVIAHMKHPAVSAAGATSLAGLLGLLDGAALFFGVDSGPMHVAAAMCTPVVALFGPMTPRINGPYGPHARVLHKDFHCPGCAHNVCRARGLSCMTSITAEEAWQAVREVVG